jgi:hypothetical protein
MHWIACVHAGYLDTMWDALRERGWTKDEYERMLEKREAIE